MPDNIYDNKQFFTSYRRLRENPFSANNIEEHPNFMDMLPPLAGKRLLDLGCGAGSNCIEFAQMGASSVLGIDGSQNMIDVANSAQLPTQVWFRRMDMERLVELEGGFDVVTSSLAVHYIADFAKLAQDVYRLLNDGGVFLFSQEHPIFTAPKAGVRWQTDIGGKVHGMVVKNYTKTGRRETIWLKKRVVKYHRTFSDILTSLIRTGFQITDLREPVIAHEYYKYDINYTRTEHVPDYLYVKAEKPPVSIGRVD